MSDGKELALIDRARKALAEARTLGEVIEIRDRAVALKHYAAKKNGAEEAERYANELRIRAERKIGEITTEMDKAKGGAPYHSRDGSGTASPPSKKSILEEHGLTENDASRFERVAAIPKPVFEDAVTKPDASTAALLKLAPPRRTRSFKAKKRTLPQGDDPRADWAERVAHEAGGEARRIRNDPFNKGILEIGRRASVLAKAMRSAAKTKGS